GGGVDWRRKEGWSGRDSVSLHEVDHASHFRLRCPFVSAERASSEFARRLGGPVPSECALPASDEVPAVQAAHRIS
ncbi:hypothetical protein PMAYCL1PPCAC_02772, partial [Pristionchus mayeri]